MGKNVFLGWLIGWKMFMLNRQNIASIHASYRPDRAPFKVSAWNLALAEGVRVYIHRVKAACIWNDRYSKGRVPDAPDTPVPRDYRRRSPSCTATNPHRSCCRSKPHPRRTGTAPSIQVRPRDTAEKRTPYKFRRLKRLFMLSRSDAK